jgi:hypothetical protein
MWTFLIMLVPLFAASGLVIPARRTYLRGVETAAESARQTFGSRSGKRHAPEPAPFDSIVFAGAFRT